MDGTDRLGDRSHLDEAMTYTFDGEVLAPFVCDDIKDLWDTHKPPLWRTWQHSKSNSKSKSAHRLTIILRKNAQFLDCNSRCDIDQLYDQFRTYLLLALAYIDKEGEEKVNNILGENYTMKIGFWSFIRDLKNVHHLAHLGLGNEPDHALVSDQDRRKEKARILKEFDHTMKGFIKKAAYVVGSGSDSNKRLEMALEIATQALMRAEEDLEWSEN